MIYDQLKIGFRYFSFTFLIHSILIKNKFNEKNYIIN